MVYQNTIDTDDAFLIWIDVAKWVLNGQITNDGEKITYDYGMINNFKYSPGCHYHKRVNSYFYGYKKLSINSDEECVCGQPTKGGKVSVYTRPTKLILYVMVS